MNISLETAKTLVTAVESGDQQKASTILHKLFMTDKGNPLYQQIGTLTRTIHEEVKSIALDQKLVQDANSLPKAQSDINYIINTAEEAASKTIQSVESILSQIEPAKKESSEMIESLSRLRQMSSTEFSQFARDLSSHLKGSQDLSQDIENHLNDILLAQSFQDLTGQVAQRISTALLTIEGNLVELLKNHNAAGVDEEVESDITPVGPNTNPDSEANVSGQEDVDDLLASLGF